MVSETPSSSKILYFNILTLLIQNESFQSIDLFILCSWLQEFRVGGTSSFKAWLQHGI